MKNASIPDNLTRMHFFDRTDRCSRRASSRATVRSIERRSACALESRSFLSGIAAFFIAGCSSPTGVKTAPFPMVSPLAAPAIPAWIAELSPRGRVNENAQIRIRFANDLVPLSELESPDRQQILLARGNRAGDPWTLPFLLTPRMIGFQADAPLPLGTRFRVTLHKGFADLAGETLSNDLAWTFETTPIAYDPLPGADASAPPVVSLHSQP